MNTPFKTLFADKTILVSFWGSILFFLITFFTVGITYRNLPPFLPLYNKLAWGYARLGHTYEIGIPIGIALLLSFLNVLFARYLYGKVPLLARFLFIVTLLIAIFTCIFILKLTLIIL